MFEVIIKRGEILLDKLSFDERPEGYLLAETLIVNNVIYKVLSHTLMELDDNSRYTIAVGPISDED